jgi:hypothetical protein
MDTSAKEHVKYVIRVKVVIICLLMISLLILLPVILFRASFIINSTFIRVAQTHESLIDFLECFLCLRISVLVRMHFQGGLLVSLFNFVLIASFSQAQDLIVVLLG